MSKIIGIIGLFLLVSITQGRKHNLVLESDGRRVITLTTFGFLQKGTLKVNVSSFAYQLIPFESHQNLKNINRNGQIGFTLSKTDNTGGNAYLENFKKNCTLTPGTIYGSEAEAKKDSINLILFTLDFDKQMLNILRIGKDVANIEVRGPSAQIVSKTARARKRSVPSLGERLSDSFLYAPLRRRREAKVTTTTTPTTTTAAVETTTASASETSSSSVSETEAAPAVETTAPKVTTTSTAPTQKKNTDKPQKPSGSVKPKPQELIKRIPISRERKDKADVFHFMFEVTINKEMEEGLYHLFMHNCLGGSKFTNPQYFGTQINLSVHIEENNSGNYLSAGEMPLPTLYFVLCCVFFAMGGIWLAVLRRARDDVYKIHFLMLTVVCLKSLSLLFHAIHFHFIEVKGTQAEAWAVLYYIAYLMKVTLLFLTILLIGAGWAFVKHMLSEKEKKLFIIFIPLQILANVAFIIVEESEEGTAVYTTWKEIFILVDLLCCGAILFPVVWSIRHLTEASHTDGKAAMNLNKLKLFRHFYMLVVCYIYFTRIIVYLLQITVPFKYSWLDELFKQAAILLFFVVTGSKFRPAPDNPYLQVPTDSDDEVEMEEVLTKPGVLETVVKVNQYNSERETTTANKRESSHEYD